MLAPFAQVRDSLLSWWQLSGHPRLWQLLSGACRPAWQLLLAPQQEQAPAQRQQKRQGVQQQQQQQQQQWPPGVRTAGHADGGSSGGSGGGAGLERLPAACVDLFYCGGAPPQLAQLLLQTPTRAALRQLLAALPGRPGVLVAGGVSGGGGGGCSGSGGAEAPGARTAG